LSALGLKGTVVFLPQSLHLVSNNLFWGVKITSSSLIEIENRNFQLLLVVKLTN
jgi:hypothetical protein